MSTTYCSDVHTYTSISLYTSIHICLYICYANTVKVMSKLSLNQKEEG